MTCKITQRGIYVFYVIEKGVEHIMRLDKTLSYNENDVICQRQELHLMFSLAVV